jgi:hypothetical protein
MTNFALDINAIIDGVVSHALTLGLFERVNGHEPANPPGNGLTAAVWVDYIGPHPGASGLAATSARLVLMVRIYSSAQSEPLDAIDPAVTYATGVLMGEYSGDFDLSGAVREVDLLGQAGAPMSAQAGYLNLDGRLYRVVTLTVPVIVSDVWTQVM